MASPPGPCACSTRWLTADPTGPHVARVQLDHSVENPASCRTALRAGFAREGVRAAFLPLRDPDAPGRGTPPRRVPARVLARPISRERRASVGPTARPFTCAASRHRRHPSGHARPSDDCSVMRIALVTEEFAPERRPRLPASPGRSSPPWSTVATTSRVRERPRPGQLPRCPDLLGEPDDVGRRRPRGHGPLPARRLPPRRPAPARHQGRGGRRTARRTDGRAGPAHAGSPASTSSTTTPACATRTCMTAGPGSTPPTVASSWSATWGRWSKKKVLGRLATVAQLPGVRLIVLGDGPGAKTLRAAGAKVIPQATGLERARCLATFDALVQPRKKEVYAPAVHEALASGVPVVAFDGGTAAVVVHEHNGLLVDTDRGGKAFARAVARLAASPDLRSTLAAKARDSSQTAPGTTPWPSWSTCTTPPPAPPRGRAGLSRPEPGRHREARTSLRRRGDGPRPRVLHRADRLRPPRGRRCPCCGSRSCCRATPAGRTCGRPRAPSSG